MNNCLKLCEERQPLGAGETETTVGIIGASTGCAGIVFLAGLVYYCALSHHFRRQVNDIEDTLENRRRNFSLYRKNAEKGGAFCCLTTYFLTPAIVCFTLYLINTVTYIHCKEGCLKKPF